MGLISPCYCGAEDCRNCHPENFIRHECEGCGEKFARLVLEQSANGLCPNCADLVQCDGCRGWYGTELLNDDRLCAGCHKK